MNFFKELFHLLFVLIFVVFYLITVEEMAGGSDVERETSRVTSLPPARVYLPNDSPIVQIASGLHHTGVC